MDDALQASLDEASANTKKLLAESRANTNTKAKSLVATANAKPSRARAAASADRYHCTDLKTGRQWSVLLRYPPHLRELVEFGEDKLYSVEAIVWHAGSRSDGMVATLTLAPQI